MFKRLLHKITTVVLITIASVTLLTGQPLSGTKTIGPGGTYPSIGAAISAASNQGLIGSLTWELVPGYSANIETYPITVPEFGGSGPGVTVTLRPQAGVNSLSIGTTDPLTFHLSGSRYFILDGRAGGSGSSVLTITNSSSNGSAIRFANGACFNSIQYVTLQGQSTAADRGVIRFDGTTGTRGNDSNTVMYCNIGDNNGNMPSIGIYSLGDNVTGSKLNEGNAILYNNIYNFWNSIGEASGIRLLGGTTGWRIEGNSFYQSSTRSGSGNKYILYINTPFGDAYDISGNYLGGSAPGCGGAKWTTNLIGGRFTGVFIATSTNRLSKFRNNTFSNASVSLNYDEFKGLTLSTGKLDIENNLIGSMTQANSLSFGNPDFDRGGGGGRYHEIIDIKSGGKNSVTVRKNRFGGIVANGICTRFSIISGADTIRIDSNTIGNDLPENIQLACHHSAQLPGPGVPPPAPADYFVFGTSLAGIYIPPATSNCHITANTVKNLRNFAPGVPSPFPYYTHGIHFEKSINVPQSTGTDTVLNNTIHDLTSDALSQADDSCYAAVGGINYRTIAFNNLISGNSIYNLSLTDTAGYLSAVGISLKSYQGSTLASRNFIHTFHSPANGSYLIGIYLGQLIPYSSSVRCINNMIRLGTDMTGAAIKNTPIIYGIFKYNGSFTVTSNTSVITGTAVDPGSYSYTFAYYCLYPGYDTLINNNLINLRSNKTTGGMHGAIGIYNTDGKVYDYNNYYVNGTGTYTGVSTLFGLGYPSLANWSNYTRFDWGSTSLLPPFENATGGSATVDLHLSNTSSRGIRRYDLSNDIDGDKRNNAPEKGADEVPADLAVVAVDSPEVNAFCGRTQDIYVRIKNTGKLPITSTVIKCEVNNYPNIAYNWTGNLLPGVTTPSIKIGFLSLPGGVYTVKTFTERPNGLLDNNNDDDTLTRVLNVTKPVYPTCVATSQITGLCPGMSLTLKAKYTDGGPSPSFVWKLNGATVGTNTDTYTSSTFANNDSVWVIFNSNAPCATTPQITTNKIKLTVGNSLVPRAVITSSDTTVCQGKSVDYFVAPENEGFTPHFQWFKNNTPVGKDSIGFQLVNPSDGDLIKCVMTSSLSCASKPRDTSAAIFIHVNPLTYPTATVYADKSSICAGSTITFRAAVQYQGTNPFYQWRLSNGLLIGDNNDTITYSELQADDSVYLTLTSNAVCATPKMVLSNNKVGIKVFPIVTPTAAIAAMKNPICNGDPLRLGVSFSNGGSAPVKEWYRNNILVQSGVDSLIVTNAANRDTFSFRLSSNANCLSKPQGNSNTIVATVNPYVSPKVSVFPSATTICSGTTVAFTAFATDGGTKPNFVWRKGKFNDGSDTPVYVTNALADGDTVFVVMTSNAQCLTRTKDTSAKFMITVNPNLIPTINISTPNNNFCEGNNLTFTASITNGGTNPRIQWVRNGLPVGTNSSTYSANNFQHTDTVYAYLTSSLPCTPAQNPSNKIILFKVPSLVASISITTPVTDICAGTSVTFNTSIGNGGDNPQFQWKVHGANAGTNAPYYTTAGLVDKDSVWVEMTSSIPCAVPKEAVSNTIGMTVRPSFTPDVVITNSVDTACSGSIVTFTATDSNGGNPPVHQWLKNDFPAGSNSNIFSTNVLSTDVIKCILTTNLPCATKLRDTATAKLSFKPAPVKPKVTRTNDTLYATVGPAYQWYVNSTELTGENKRYLVVYHNGTFKVGVDSAGCRSISNPYNVTHFVGVDELAEGFLTVIPNPSAGHFEISLNQATAGTCDLEVYDARGRLVVNQHNLETTSLHQYALDLSHENSGMYLLRILTADRILTQKVVKTE